MITLYELKYIWCSSSPSARGVVARKASLRDSVGFRCSPRKPPRTTRLTDGGVKARVQHAKVELSIESLEPPQRGENYHLTGARNDSTGLEQQQQTSSNLNKNNGASSRSTDAGGLRRKNSATQPMPSPVCIQRQYSHFVRLLLGDLV